jgi:hypothetical protein
MNTPKNLYYARQNVLFRLWLRDVLRDSRVLCKDVDLYMRLMRMV